MLITRSFLFSIFKDPRSSCSSVKNMTSFWSYTRHSVCGCPKCVYCSTPPHEEADQIQECMTTVRLTGARRVAKIFYYPTPIFSTTGGLPHSTTPTFFKTHNYINKDSTQRNKDPEQYGMVSIIYNKDSKKRNKDPEQYGMVSIVYIILTIPYCSGSLFLCVESLLI